MTEDMKCPICQQKGYLQKDVLVMGAKVGICPDCGKIMQCPECKVWVSKTQNACMCTKEFAHMSRR